MVKILTVLASVFPASIVAAQTTAPAEGWSGQLQCVISVRASGYQDDQTHTWVLSGAPTARSDFRDYPATWTVKGAGNKTAAAGPGGAGSWTRTGSDMNASVTMFVPGNTTSIRVAPGQRAVASAGGLRGTMATGPFTMSADEWRFQYFDIPGGASQTQLSGARTLPITQAVGWRQPAGAAGTETCTWNFSKASGGTPSSSGATSSTPQSLAPAGGPRVIALTGFVAAGSGAGSFDVVPPRTIALAGFSAGGSGGGSFVVVPPRTVALAGFTAAGAP